jgi:miniconductance mechanosensitive channel
MEPFDIRIWIGANPAWAVAAATLLFVLILFLARLIFGRGLVYITTRTKNKYDDIIVKGLRPLRASLLAPFIVAFAVSDLAFPYQDPIKKIALFFILWISILTIIGLLDAFNQVYESTSSFNGVSIQGYLDIAKIFLFLVGIILSITLITGESPVLLLSGLGAMTAVLLLIFQDTIMALIASIQISANNLVKEGDWLEVPSYDADGIVMNMSLHAIKIQNWDKTITVIPTYKIMDTSYKNWRGMEESGGRRIMRSIRLDLNSVKFCTPEMIECYSKIDMISAYVDQRRTLVEDFKKIHHDIDSPLDGPQVTNMEIFREYIETYLINHPDIHTENMDFIIRELAPSSTGLPVEIYVFTRTTQWKQYERIQGEIVDHLLAAASFFDLRLFQEPAGSDFVAAFQRG